MIPIFLRSCESSVSIKEHVIEKKEKWRRTRDFLARLLNLPLIYPVTDNLFLGNSKKLNLCHNYNKESYPLLRRFCVTCNIQEQLLSRVSSTENCVYETLGKSLESYVSRRVISRGATLLKLPPSPNVYFF